jgi:hypothetical protein
MMIIATDNREYYEALQAHYDAGRWSEYLMMCANQDRAQELLKIITTTRKPSRLWSLVNEVWSMSNNISADQHIWDCIWSHAFTQSGKLRKCSDLMRPCDRHVFDSLPETVPIYRGCSHVDAVEGYSWTLDKSVAESFACRVSGQTGRALVAAVDIPREFILAYFNEREEQEIVVNRLAFDWLNAAINLSELEIEKAA